MAPPAPTATTAKFARVSPAATFTFDDERVDPDGNTDTNVAALGSVTVTFTTTADASSGTPGAIPAIGNDSVSPAPNVCNTPGPRLSATRTGANAENVDVPTPGAT